MDRIRGFTLYELLIAMAVLAVVVAMAAPNLTTLIESNRMSAQLNSFVGALQAARSEAAKRGARVTVCKSKDNACTTNGDWSQGWLVFIDEDNDETYEPGDGEVLISAGNPLGGGNTLRGNANVASIIKFDSRGFSQGYNGTLTLCDSRGDKYARGIIISNSGRVRRSIDSNSDGYEEDGSGDALTCP